MMKRWRAIIAIVAILTVGVRAAGIAAAEDAAAASVESCANSIIACGCTITKKGTYTVNADLSIVQGQTSDGDCLDVRAAHVLLFLNGYGIDGAGTGVGLHVLSTANNAFIEGAKSSQSSAATDFTNITHFASGVLYEAANGTMEGFAAKHNTGVGVWLSRANGNNLSNFGSNQNAIYGVWLEASSTNHIHAANLNNNGTGIYLGCSAAGPDGKKCHGIPGSNNNLLFNLGAGDSSDMTTGNTAYGIAIDLGNSGNFVTGDQAFFNPTADLLDNNPGCGHNFWINNRFVTTAPAENAGCLK
jgi:hypothetical protein